MWGGAYNETFINITWNPATDSNPGDILTYNISLLNADERFNQTLNVTTTTSYYWNTTDISDGDYNLRLEVCDDATPSLCVNSTLGGNFTLDKITPVYTLTSRSIISNNSFNSSLANAGDLIVVYFNSSGPLINPNITFYSGGYPINNNVTIENTSNSYNTTYIVNESDFDGGIDFEIIADNLDIKYIDSENSDVFVDKTAPSLEIISPTATTYTSATQLLNISATDNHLSTIWYNWNGTNTTYSSQTNIYFSEGSNNIFIWTNDSLGNLNSTNVIFTISTPVAETPTTTTSGGGYAPKTYYTNEIFPTEGNNFELRWNDKIKFSVRTNNHTLTMMQFNTTHAKVKIESEPIIVWLEKDFLYEFDLDNDSVMDVRVRYEGRDNLNRAKVFIQEIVYLVEESLITGEVVGDVEDDEGNLSWLWIVLGVVVFIILIYIFLKRKSYPKSSFRKRSKT